MGTIDDSIKHFIHYAAMAGKILLACPKVGFVGRTYKIRSLLNGGHWGNAANLSVVA